MNQEQVIARVIRACGQAGLTHMVVGSFASNYHGVPRMTQDADIVVEGSRSAVLALVRLLSDEFYVSEDAALEAIRYRKLFNAIHLETGFKIDVIVKKARPFSDEELRRRLSGVMGAEPAAFATPEDTVLTKLEWAKEGDSERQYNDAVGVIQVQSDALDWDYIDRWAGELGVSELVARARDGSPFRDR